MGLQSTSTAGTVSGVSTGRPSAHTPDLSLTCPSSGADPISSSVSSSSAPQNETNGSITSSPSSQSLAVNTTLGTAPPSSSSFNPGLESNSTYPSTSTSARCTGVQPESQDPSSRVLRAFNVVPDYGIASRGFIGGVPPLSSMRGLPSYEEAETQRREREAAQVLKDGDVENQTQIEQMKKERGSMSEPDLVGRFGHAGVRFEYSVQAGNEAEVGTCQSMYRGASGGVGVMREDADGDDDDDDDIGGADAIQMHTKKARP